MQPLLLTLDVRYLLSAAAPEIVSGVAPLRHSCAIAAAAFHAKLGTTKDRNGMDLREAEDIKKRWREYTKELYKKDLHNQIIMMV